MVVDGTKLVGQRHPHENSKPNQPLDPVDIAQAAIN
jgi:hypothetical protein